MSKKEEPESRTVVLRVREIQLILKSLKKCVPEAEDQEEVFNLAHYLELELGQ